jgi:hypothetical protein
MFKKEQRYSKLAITVVIAGSVLLSLFFKWSNAYPNFMDGDARDYYSALVSIFIRHDFTHQSGSDWYLLHTSSGTVNVHPIGVALLQLPFFLLAWLYSIVADAGSDGYSLPFQIAVATAALVYAGLGLNYLRRLLHLLGFADALVAGVILLLYFGTNLLHYTLSEAGMSHVYSFALISSFLFYSARLYKGRKNSDLLKTGLVVGLILLVRPNNIFILPAALLWCSSFDDCKNYLKSLFSRPAFYASAGIALVILALQTIVWYVQTGSFLQDTYKRDGFYWLDPQVIKFLFGFDGGFFIYTPLCLLFIAGLIFTYRSHRFMFFVLSGLLLGLFYFFSSYWAYTYFDGFVIHVLVDYYGLFGILAAHLFSGLSARLYLAGIVALAFLVMNLIYTYQVNEGIIARSGMTFNMWKYVFLKTDAAYRYCLGGSHELKPYAPQAPAVLDSAAAERDFDFEGKEFGPVATSHALPVKTRRLHAEVACSRREKMTGASSEALLVLSVTRPEKNQAEFYSQFLLNEVPAKSCCESVHYAYTCNLVGEFEKGDQVTAYIWNRKKAPFLLERLAFKLYNYNYDLN